MNNRIVLENKTLVRWNLRMTIVESSCNSLEIAITQPIDQSLETRHILYNLDIDAFIKFLNDLKKNAVRIKKGLKKK